MRCKACVFGMLLLVGACGDNAGGPSDAGQDGGTKVVPTACLSDRGCDIPLVSAHRGLCGDGPENTVRAFLNCQQRGVPMVEIDTRETSDGAVVIMHDDDVDRTTDGEVRFPGRTRVADLSLAEFKSLVMDDERCEQDPDADPWRCHPPTFQEVLEETAGQLLLDVDFKAGDPAQMARLVQAAGAEERILMFDSNVDNLRGYRAIIPDGVVMPRAHDADEVRTLLAAGFEDLDLRWIHGDPPFIAEVASEIQAAGVRLYVNGWDRMVDTWLFAAEIATDPEQKAELEAEAWRALDGMIAEGASCFGTDFAHRYAEHLYPDGFGTP